MIALDTNLLVRFLVRDDPAQSQRAKAVVDRLDDDDQRGYISDIVLCELVCVLTRSYQLDRTQVTKALSQLAAAKQLCFDNVDHLLRALAAYEQGKGDFSDYLLREHAKVAGCESIMTFDKRLLKEEMFASP